MGSVSDLFYSDVVVAEPLELQTTVNVWFNFPRRGLRASDSGRRWAERD